VAGAGPDRDYGKLDGRVVDPARDIYASAGAMRRYSLYLGPGRPDLRASWIFSTRFRGGQVNDELDINLFSGEQPYSDCPVGFKMVFLIRRRFRGSWPGWRSWAKRCCAGRTWRTKRRAPEAGRRRGRNRLPAAPGRIRGQEVPMSEQNRRNWTRREVLENPAAAAAPSAGWPAGCSSAGGYQTDKRVAAGCPSTW
jgi:hypothetical protein